MEDHRDAYFRWKELGIQGACCLHVDAHLDMADFPVPPETDVSDADVNCGNYLLRAVEEGIVRKVVWVVPRPMLEGSAPLDWVRAELPRWASLTLDEYHSLHAVGSTVSGRLRGAELLICDCLELPATDPEWLLDLDIDYFLDSGDQVWQTPLELYHKLGGEFKLVTVAYSVKGGYTPPQFRYLGDLSLMLWSGQTSEARRWAQALGAEAENQQTPAALAAARAANAVPPRWQEAETLDPRYRRDPFDMASGFWLRKRPQECEEWLARIAPEDLRAAYIRAFLAYNRRDYGPAARAWEQLADSQPAAVDAVTMSHLRYLSGRSWLLAGQPRPAQLQLQAAAQLQPRRPEIWRELGRAQRELGEMAAASQSWRRALRLSPQLLDNLQVQAELVELFLHTGQNLLARAELAKLTAFCLPAELQTECHRLAQQLARTT